MGRRRGGVVRDYSGLKGMRVARVREGGTGAEIGMAAGEEILEINGAPVPDLVAYQFLIAEEEVTVLTRRPDGTLHEYELEKDAHDDLDVEPTPLNIRVCGNHCVFCFVDQLPPGLRSTLYVKDDDFRHSFLHGNYITLTTLREREISRLIREKLSPLYVSVHATDDTVRRTLLGKERAPPIMDLLRRLTQNGIHMHTQAVLCPGLNDGDVLRRTIEDLRGLGPHVESLAVVPLGLTRHRENLPSLQGYTRAQAAAVLDVVHGFQDQFRAQDGQAFVHAADEFYLKAGRTVPGEAGYDGYPQLDNGVGLVRDFLTQLSREVRRLPRRLAQPRTMLLVTGTSFAPVLRQACERLRGIEGLTVEVVAAENRLLGSTVTVAGLLCGRDIVAAVKGRRADVVVVPSIAVRDGYGVFLDDLTPLDVERAAGLPVMLAEPSARGLVDAVRALKEGLSACA
jgi:putative radical SAM enzyme (TIGR03279 family)